MPRALPRAASLRIARGGMNDCAHDRPVVAAYRVHRYVCSQVKLNLAMIIVLEVNLCLGDSPVLKIVGQSEQCVPSVERFVPRVRV